MLQPTKELALKQYSGYRAIPLYQTLEIGELTPLAVFEKLKAHSRHCFILESASETGERGRYTFLGYDPKLLITAEEGEIFVKNGTEIKASSRNPGEFVAGIIDDWRSPKLEGLPPFTGGLVGYFSYEFSKYAEPSLRFTKNNRHFCDMDLMLFDKVLAFDSENELIYIIVNFKTDYFEENYNRAALELASIRSIIFEGEAASIPPLKLEGEFTATHSRERYSAMVERAKHHIVEGDIFQVVLSNRFSAKASGSIYEVYKGLRHSNPSPYMFFFSGERLEVAGSSPETLCRLNNGKVYTYPLAGTRKRGGTEAEDLQLERELLLDEKELAEHNMLVDLGRNDLGRVSRFGSVKVTKYMDILRFSRVMHIGSEVEGELRPELNAVDVLSSVLPAGTLSGAPKIRAMQLIDELEDDSRGLYGGGVGYISMNGDMDVCIAIRIAYMIDGEVTVRAGAGIVADSVPENEYTECRNKAGAVIDAVLKAGGKA
ncbi:MAG: anthranilate synthase component I family protein [Oscillospiraceae bacterium]|jgi:anthranilate synthase component 1|nr:anthranilate synthase component I family protein [Oscillospiraceae bacterium]